MQAQKLYQLMIRVVISALILLAVTTRPAFADQQTSKVPGPTKANATTDHNMTPIPSRTGFSLNDKIGLQYSPIQLNGFLSAGLAATDAKTAVNGQVPKYIIPNHGAIGNDLNFSSVSLIGIQVTAKLSDKICLVGQFVADGDDTNGNSPYTVNAQWAFLRYQPSRHFAFRAGRFRLPAFLYSETAQVGYTYPWMFLPNEVYRIIPFYNLNGVDITYSFDLGNTGWVVKVSPYYGENQSKFDLYTRGAVPTTAGPIAIAPGQTATFNENNIAGIVASISNPFITLRSTYAHADLTGYLPNFFVPTAGNISLPLFNNQSSNFYSFGAQFNLNKFLLVSEYAHRDTPLQLASLSGVYATLGYHIHKLLPNFTFAHLWTTNKLKMLTLPVSELPQDQNSYTVGASYYLNNNLVIKASVSYIEPLNGTNGLFTVNPRKNVLLYGLAIDAVF